MTSLAYFGFSHLCAYSEYSEHMVSFDALKVEDLNKSENFLYLFLWLTVNHSLLSLCCSRHNTQTTNINSNDNNKPVNTREKKVKRASKQWFCTYKNYHIGMLFFFSLSLHIMIYCVRCHFSVCLQMRNHYFL